MAYVAAGDKDSCWLWTGAVKDTGYGVIRIANRLVIATRAAWEVYHGEPPNANLMVCHSCDNTLCVNPKHLWLGTAKQNAQDAMRKGRLRSMNLREAQRLIDARLPLRAAAKCLGVSHTALTNAIKRGRLTRVA